MALLCVRVMGGLSLPQPVERGMRVFCPSGSVPISQDMRSRLTLAAAILAVLAASTLLAFANTSAGDYPNDAAPAIDALLDGEVRAALAEQPLMGSLSVIVRLPFAGLARLTGGDDLLGYQLGTIPCLVSVGLLGLVLAGLMRRRGQPPWACAAAALLCLLTPLTWEAIRLGHPEELLAASLCVGAVLLALRGRPLAAGIVLGLALGTKQWALIAALPVLAAAPARRWRVVLAAGVVAVVLTAPLVAGNLSSFSTTTEKAAWAGERVHPFNAVWPVAISEDRVISVGDDQSVVTVRVLPRWLAHLIHPAIVLLAVPLTFLWWRSPRRTPDDVLALLALLFLARCLLDPVNNAYYHVPFLLSLTAWEGLTRRGPPLVSLLSAAAIYYTIYKAGWSDDVAVRNALYLLATLPVAVWLTARLYAPAKIGRLRATRAWPSPVRRAPA
jgi:hypothetical protein